MTGCARKFYMPAVVAMFAAGAAAFAQSPNPNLPTVGNPAHAPRSIAAIADPARAQQEISAAQDAVMISPAVRSRPAGRAIAPHGRAKSSGFFSIFSNPAGAMRRPEPPNRPACCNALEPPAKSARAAQWRHRRTRRPEAISADRARGQWLWRAISVGSIARPARRFSSDRLFGNNPFSAPSGQMGGTFRTICVRTCGGFTDFPISYPRPRRIASATTSKRASACARHPKFRCTAITTPARK